MAYVGGTASRGDRAKALIGVAAVHVALGLALLSGLSVTLAHEVADHLKTFDVREVPPPPPVKPPPPKAKAQAKKAAGAPAPKAKPTQIVAPPPRLPVPSPIPAAKIAGTGSAPSSGAALAGNGTGAGGAGNGAGGGYGGFTPARQITTIPNREYRRLAASGVVNGTVGITLLVNPDGSVTNCRIARSSGNGYADATMCQLATYYVRFRPALDASGRPVAQDITWFPRWWRP